MAERAVTGAFDRLAPAFFIGSLAMAVGMLLWNAARSYAAWPNTSDDMFYYLVLVRETAAHGVVSVDGLRPTNGFHPLWFLLLCALQPLVTPESLPGTALAVLAFAHALASVILWRTLRRLTSPSPAALIASLYAANPFLLRVLFAAVETSLAACLVGVCLWAHLRWLERARTLDRTLSLAALTLAVAARTDTALLAAGLAGSAALVRLRASRDLGAAMRAIDWAPLAAALLPVLAFGAWSQAATGEFLQTSGRSLSFWQSVGDWRLIREAVSVLGPVATPATALVYILEVKVQFIGWVTRAPIELLGHHPLGLLLGAALIIARFAIRSRSEAPAVAPSDTPAGAEIRQRLQRELLTFQLLLWTFYALLFRHCQVWYWHTSLYAFAILIGVWLSPGTALGRSAGAWLAIPALRRGIVPLLVLGALALTWGAVDDFRPRKAGSSPAPTAAPADPLAQIPDGATLGAFDTGQLGWEHPRLRVVNLDGLVNNAAYRALRARRIGRYMLDEGVEWLYVRDRVVDRFRAFGLQEWLDAAEPAGRSECGVGLYRVRDRARP